MNKEIQDVEAKLTAIGRRCNTNVIGKKSAHLIRIERDNAGSGMNPLRLSMIAWLTFF
jgi:hypothetical protein